MLSLIALSVATAAASQPATVKSGVEHWKAGEYAAAVADWLPYAAQGDADACFNMGQAYKLGRGVNKDQGLARDYYRKAALKGHLPAQANLGIALFQAGDKLEAVKWLKTAADRGEMRAQYVLGIAAYNGDGTPKNLGLAYGYLLRAQASGLPQATTALASIEPTLSPAARGAGTAMSASLAAGNGVPAALAAASGPAGVQRPGPAAAVSAAASNVVTSVRNAFGLETKPVVPAARPPVQTADAAVKPAPARPAPSVAPRPVTTPAAVPARSQADNDGTQPGPRPIAPSGAVPQPRPIETAQAVPDPKPVTPPAPATIGPPSPNDGGASTPVATAAIPPGSPAALPSPAPAAASTAKAPASRAAAKPSAVTETADAKPAPAKPAGWRVQLGAFSSQKQADAAWASLRSANAGAIGKAKPIFDASGPVVKFQLGPFASRDAARDTCAKLAFAGKACFVTQG